MDFSANVDSSLRLTSPLLSSSSSPSLSPTEYLGQLDFDLFQGFKEALYPDYTMVETIKPSLLTDSPGSSSWSDTSSLSSPEYTPLSTPPPEPAKRHYNKRKSTTAAVATHHHDQHQHDDHRVKRHQTKLACIWCRKLGKKCDAQRPCGRCVQFDRCDECIDAPPRRPRRGGVDRGTYKKTRDLAAVDYQQAMKQREAYVEKVRRKGRVVQLGLTADDILEKTKQDDARFKTQSRRFSSESLTESHDAIMDSMDTVEQTVLPTGVEAPKETIFEQGGFIPFTGLLEDLFTCSAAPEMNDLFSPVSPVSPASTASPLFDMLSPEMLSPPTEMTSPQQDQLDFGVMTPEASWEWQAWEQYPNVMKLIASTKVVETPYSLESEELQPWIDIALAA